MESILRNAIARIDVVQNGRILSRGTGFLVGEGLVLTALHVVADRMQLTLAPYPGEIVLTFPGVTVKADIHDQYWDRLADWALLRCRTVPQVRSIPLAELREDAVTWETYGFPDANPNDGMVTGGSVSNHQGTLEGNPVLQLFSREAAAGQGAPVRGLSGSPVIVQNAVVGLLRFALMKDGQTVAGTVYACPVTCMLQKTGNLLPLPDPCLGLPGLPRQPLPAEPFRNLAWFTSREAEVFFGRNREIRQMYERLTLEDAPPILLLYGQSGVGKSSFLDAGLLPRLHWYHQVCYLRRDSHGTLLGTLRESLNLHGGEPAESAADLTAAWHAVEQGGGKPLVVFFDQVEEVYTHPNPQAPSELAEFAREIGRLFAPSNAPSGRLVLSFRKEWLPDIQKQMEVNTLQYTKVFLEGLDRQSVIGAITGLTLTERLRQFYGLTIDPGLPEQIAADLLADPDSPIAPTLQILLTKLWAKATGQSRNSPVITAEHYRVLKQEGLLLGDFLDQQLGTLRAAHSEWVESGLALDVLACHTTASLTARECSLDELLETYRHRSSDIPPLVQELKDLFLLSDSSPDDDRKSTRLCHDTLAQVVLQRYVVSQNPGQRARRIIEGRVGDWAEGSRAGLLDEGSLEIVERGAAGMRQLQPKEQKLVYVSRLQQQERQKQRKRLQLAGIAAAVLILAAAVTAGVEWRLAVAAEIKEKAQELVAHQEADVAGQEAQKARDQKKEADRQRSEADTQKATANTQRERADREAKAARMQLALSNSLRLLGEQPSQALLPALAAVGRSFELGAVDPQAQSVLYRALNESRQENVFEVRVGLWSAADWTKDGKLAVLGIDSTTKPNTLNIDLYDPSGTRAAAIPLSTFYPEVSEWPGSVMKFSPDGKLVALAGQEIRILDRSGKVVHSFDKPSGSRGYAFVTFTPEEQDPLLLAMTQEFKVRAWSTANWQLLWENQGSKDTLPLPVLAVGRRTAEKSEISIFAGGPKGSLVVWSKEGKQLGTIAAAVKARAFAFLDVPSGPATALAVQSAEDTVQVWSETSARPRELRFPNHLICGLKFNPQGDVLAITMVDPEGTTAAVRFANPLTGLDAMPAQALVRKEGCPALAFEPGGGRLALSANNALKEGAPAIRVVDMNGPMYQPPLQTSPVPVKVNSSSHLLFSPDGQYLLAAISTTSPNGRVSEEMWIRDLRKNETRHWSGAGAAIQVAFSPNSKLIAAGYYSPGQAAVWKVTGEVVRPLTSVAERIWNLGFNRDGTRLFLNTEGAALTTLAFDLPANGAAGPWPAGKAVPLLQKATVTSFSADGRFATVLYEGPSRTSVQVWNSDGSPVAAAFQAKEGNSMRLSPNGKMLFEDKPDRLSYRSVDGRPLPPDTITAGFSGTPAFSPDGALVYRGEDTVGVFDRATGQKLVEFGLKTSSEQTEPTTLQIAVSPDGRTLATLQNDGSIRLWRAAWREWLEAACNRFRIALSNQPASDPENLKYAQDACRQVGKH